MSSWYVVNTRTKQEERARDNLIRQGYRVWLPMLGVVRRHARRIELVRTPLFPGYLFVELEHSAQPWRPINGTFGVRRLLCQHDKPASVPSQFMGALRESCDADGLVAIPQTALTSGQLVRVITGPLMDCIGTIVRSSPNGRVALLLSFLGGQVEANAARHDVAPVA